MTSVYATEYNPPIRVQKTATHADKITDWVKGRSKMTVKVAPNKEYGSFIMQQKCWKKGIGNVNLKK